MGSIRLWLWLESGLGFSVRDRAVFRFGSPFGVCEGVDEGVGVGVQVGLGLG